MYRFRSLKSLLDRKELENQEIYFASLDQLNDPMEGLRGVYWEGDEIVWKNFFKHYVLCLSNFIDMYSLIPENKEVEEVVLKHLDIYKLQSLVDKNKMERTYKYFFENEVVKNIINSLKNAKYKITRDILQLDMNSIHLIAVHCINKVLGEDYNINYKSYITNMKLQSKQDGYNNIYEIAGVKTLDKLMEGQNNIFESMFFTYSYELSRNKEANILFTDFPKIYLNLILKLTYPNVYIACFMEECTDSSIWGTYGENHTGVCLKFKVFKENSKIKFNNFNIGELKKIKYTEEVPSLNFFTNLGKLTPKELDNWYNGEDGTKSKCYDDIFSDREKWHKKHWEQFETSLLRKFPDWEKEKEYRIILVDLLMEYEDRKARTLEYDFNDLESITFGMNTPSKAKFRIIEIIEDKCKKNERNNFEFYEMYYSYASNELKSRGIYTINLKNQKK